MSSLIPPPYISVSSILSLSVKPSALYNITLSTILGATVYTTFISGVIAYKTLPRQQFGNLQSKLVPAHFTLTTTLSTGLLAAWIGLGNFAGKRWSDFRDAKVFNGWVLAGLVGLGAANLFVVVPWTSAYVQVSRFYRASGILLTFLNNHAHQHHVSEAQARENRGKGLH